jgi:hypothetical protein
LVENYSLLKFSSNKNSSNSAKNKSNAFSSSPSLLFRKCSE